MITFLWESLLLAEARLHGGVLVQHLCLGGDGGVVGAVGASCGDDGLFMTLVSPKTLSGYAIKAIYAIKTL